MSGATVDSSALEAAVRTFAAERAQRLGDAFADVVRRNAPRRSGTLADSVETGPVQESANGQTIRVNVTADYARYVNDGTGIYGPEGTPITPRRFGGVLVFDWPAAGGLVFARSVRGSEPTHFWERSLDQWPQIVGDVA